MFKIDVWYRCKIAFVNRVYQYFGFSIVRFKNGIHRKLHCSLFIHNIVITIHITCDSLKFKVENHCTHPLLHTSINWSIYSHIIRFSMHPFIHLTIHPFIHSSIRLFNPSHPVSYLSVSLCHDKLSTSTSDLSPLCLSTYVATCLSTCLLTDHKSTSPHFTYLLIYLSCVPVYWHHTGVQRSRQTNPTIVV